MNAAGLSLTQAEKTGFLSAALTDIRSYKGSSGPASMAKLAIALSSLGIDARQIPAEDGTVIDLVSKISKDTGYLNGTWGAPYVLALYELGNYQVPETALHTRESLIQAILDGASGWGLGGFDGYGIVFAGLAPYYNANPPKNGINGISASSCSAITAAIDSAIDTLSSAQAIDGSFGSPNSNTVAMVMTGLNALGIDSHKDSRFVKSGSSLLNNLLSFRTADNKLGYQDGKTANTMSCVQGFQALATWQNLQVGAGGQGQSGSTNLYHFTKEVAPYTSWPGAKLLTSISIKLPQLILKAWKLKLFTTEILATVLLFKVATLFQPLTQLFPEQRRLP